MNFKVLVITDRLDYWFDYFREGLHGFCTVSNFRRDIRAKNGFFSAKIRSAYYDEMRGYDPEKLFLIKMFQMKIFVQLVLYLVIGKE